MCWGPRASFGSFAAGLLVCFLAYRLAPGPQMRLVCLVWSFVLLMQVAEGFIWLDQGCGPVNRAASRCALFLNVLQPVVVYMLCINLDRELNATRRLLASAAIFAYLAYLLPTLYGARARDDVCTRPAEGCKHLDLSVWRHASGLAYALCLFSVVLALVRPAALAVLVVATLFSALAASMLFCGAASLWCWLVVPAPLLFALALARREAACG